MPRHFNTAGPCRPHEHYMIAPERRIPAVRDLIEQGLYFVVHAPRQSGKTTCFQALARTLTAGGSYTALLSSCETGQKLEPDSERSIGAVLWMLQERAESSLPPELRPPAPDATIPSESRLYDLLARWASRSPRPIVLFLDEIDALSGDALISVLRQLRSGYNARPGGSPHSVALIGLRDVRDYRLQARPDSRSLGTSSPFNVKVESIRLANFTAAEVAELYSQHTADTGQVFTPEALALAWELTRGQPWLVNALARQAVERIAPDPAQPVTKAVIEAAKEVLIQRRDTHLDSLIDRLRETRVRRVIEPILGGELLPPESLADDIQFVLDLGLVASGPRGLEIANPIYREVIPRALTWIMELSMAFSRADYVSSEGRLRFDLLLRGFQEFWCENAEAFLERAPYSEAAAQLVFMAYLHKVVNGGGFIDRELAVGSGRIDLCVRWPSPAGVERWALEIKVWRDRQADPLAKGLRQLTAYLRRLGLDRGTLILFDARTTASPLPDRCSTEEREQDGCTVTVLRL
ncbi:MAG TPA: polyketide biosynthesis operon protein CyrO [Acidobacteria bacterium]|nr:polyketide biosynthesis operon protein CyrO [Acidobacteriota bacterium]